MPKKSRLPARSRTAPKKRALIFALTSLEHDVEQLPKEFEYVLHPGKHLWLTYLRGIVYGLGALTAVVVVIPVILWGMRKVEWVPVIGDFVSKVVTQVEMVQPR